MDKLYRLSAFPKTKSGGNLAGVYIGADSLSDIEMLQIALNVGYSETAFVMESKVADFKVRFFTPLSEVDLCGHATIATFNLLRNLGVISLGNYTQETKAGILNLVIKETEIFMEQPSPMYGKILKKSELLKCFDTIAFDESLLPQILSTGLREIFLPINNRYELDQLNPNFDNIIALSKKYNVIGIHAFCLDQEIDAYGRNFAPIVGANEESATGTSNGALGCYLYKYVEQKEKYILRQGYKMKQPSEITTILESNNNQIQRVWVGGSAIVI